MEQQLSVLILEILLIICFQGQMGQKSCTYALFEGKPLSWTGEDFLLLNSRELPPYFSDSFTLRECCFNDFYQHFK